MLDTILSFMPSALRHMISKLPEGMRHQLEEIRVRENRPLEIIYAGKSQFLSRQGVVMDAPQGAYCPAREDCTKLLDLLTNHSLYTFEEELKKGYITVIGGHRVGLAGRTVLEHGKVKHIRDISSFNIRLAREVIDAGKHILPHLWDDAAGTVHHTLVISPPQQGKTTLIRDMARLLSYGNWMKAGSKPKGLKVGIVDERSEIAACVKGVPRFDVGPRTDVLDSCPKAEGMMMMIRSMSPEVLVVDEVGRTEDALSIHEALHAGIRVIATAHGLDLTDAKQRPILQQLMTARVFTRYVVLNKIPGGAARHSIHDQSGNCLILDHWAHL